MRIEKEFAVVLWVSLIKKNSVFFWIWNLPNRLKCQSFRFLGIFSSLLFVLLLGALLLSFYQLKRLRLITRKNGC
ncbi:hypothetical protein EUGRSUZ_H03511 [Eucalyptus grandis]|uniref:Uncharacterized protein n=2 Tax=Eucalyptus grandis TaxID=71139 RepID=A0A059B3G9_EUCGR|nr:hypothetical protein EUGRSUZ_H03511 [Eucalyptus grandis]